MTVWIAVDPSTGGSIDAGCVAGVYSSLGALLAAHPDALEYCSDALDAADPLDEQVQWTQLEVEG